MIRATNLIADRLSLVGNDLMENEGDNCSPSTQQICRAKNVVRETIIARVVSLKQSKFQIANEMYMKLHDPSVNFVFIMFCSL